MTCVEALQAAKDNPGKIRARCLSWEAYYALTFLPGKEEFRGVWDTQGRKGRLASSIRKNLDITDILAEWETVPTGESK